MIDYNFVALPKIYRFLSGNELKVFVTMFDKWSQMKNEDGWYYRSWKDLRVDTGLSNNGLNNAINGLLSKNLLSKREYPKKEQRSNDYQINLEGVYALANIPTPKKRVTYSQKESTSKNKENKNINKIYKIKNISMKNKMSKNKMSEDDVDKDFNLIHKGNGMSNSVAIEMNEKEQGRSIASESGTENEMTTSTSGEKDITSKGIVNKFKVINKTSDPTQGFTPHPQIAPTPLSPSVWDENEIFGTGEPQNVSGDKLSTNEDKTCQNAQECPQNETIVFRQIEDILEESLNITDVEPFKAKLQEALDLLRQIRPTANRNAFTRCCNDTICWFIHNNWDDLDMFFVASNFKRDIEQMKRA